MLPIPTPLLISSADIKQIARYFSIKMSLIGNNKEFAIWDMRSKGTVLPTLTVQYFI